MVFAAYFGEGGGWKNCQCGVTRSVMAEVLQQILWEWRTGDEGLESFRGEVTSGVWMKDLAR